MPDALIEKISKIAATQDVSFNKVVIQCCEFALEHLPEKENK